MQYYTFSTKDKASIEEGSIVEFLRCEYRKDCMDYVSVFKLIGKPVGKPSIEVEFV